MRRRYPVGAAASQLSGSGQWLWAKHFGGVEPNDLGDTHHRVTGVVTDLSGAIFVVGNFVDSLGAANVKTNGGDDVFVMRLSPAGNVEWARGFGSSYTGDHGWSIGIS